MAVIMEMCISRTIWTWAADAGTAADSIWRNSRRSGKKAAGKLPAGMMQKKAAVQQQTEKEEQTEKEQQKTEEKQTEKKQQTEKEQQKTEEKQE